MRQGLLEHLPGYNINWKMKQSQKTGAQFFFSVILVSDFPTINFARYRGESQHISVQFVYFLKALTE